MTNHDCVIGLLHKVDYDELVTLKELQKHMAVVIKVNEWCKSDGLDILCSKEWSLKDYCDKRKATDLTRFDYCPYCGKKIEWKKIKEETA